jgi:hypothetical protein
MVISGACQELSDLQDAGFAAAGLHAGQDQPGGDVEVVGGVGVGVPEREHRCAVLGREDVEPEQERGYPVEHLVSGVDGGVFGAPEGLAVLRAEVSRR